LQGRHTTFVAFFAVVGTALQYFHRLDSTYIAFMTSLMGFVLGHSIKEDHYEAKGKDNGSESKSVPTAL